MWWLYTAPDWWEWYALRAAWYSPCRPLIHGPPWEDTQ